MPRLIVDRGNVFTKFIDAVRLDKLVDGIRYELGDIFFGSELLSTMWTITQSAACKRI